MKIATIRHYRHYRPGDTAFMSDIHVIDELWSIGYLTSRTDVTEYVEEMARFLEELGFTVYHKDGVTSKVIGDALDKKYDNLVDK